METGGVWVATRVLIKRTRRLQPTHLVPLLARRGRRIIARGRVLKIGIGALPTELHPRISPRVTGLEPATSPLSAVTEPSSAQRAIPRYTRLYNFCLYTIQATLAGLARSSRGVVMRAALPLHLLLDAGVVQPASYCLEHRVMALADQDGPTEVLTARRERMYVVAMQRTFAVL